MMAGISVYQLKWHCHVAVTMSTQLIQPANSGNSVILEQKILIQGICIISYYIHESQASLYFNCTTLDLYLSQLHPYDYILLGGRVIHFRGKFKGSNRALGRPQEDLNKMRATVNFPVMWAVQATVLCRWLPRRQRPDSGSDSANERETRICHPEGWYPGGSSHMIPEKPGP